MIRNTLRLGSLLLLVPLLGGQSCPPVERGVTVGVGVEQREADFSGGGGSGCSRFMCDPLSREEAAAILFAAVAGFAIYTASTSSSSGGQQGSDARLKRDIQPVAAFHNGLKLYAFRYLDDDTRYVGVIAQELLGSDSDMFRQAVIAGPDRTYAVDYDRLGIGLVTLERFLQVAREICHDPQAACRNVPASSVGPSEFH